MNASNKSGHHWWKRGSVLTETRKLFIDCRVNLKRSGRGEKRKLLVELGQVWDTAALVVGTWPRDTSQTRGPSSFLGIPEDSATPTLIESLCAHKDEGDIFLLSHLLGLCAFYML